MQTQLKKWGNSFAVRLPRSLVEDFQLKEGAALDISVARGSMVLRPAVERYALNDLLKQITPENCHGETSWGQPIGNESW
ncbi:MAG TPA: AbrB/MazE/SpoVT family DNA-binding domain-containing protein [Gemmatales bacterium]|nr:AbrB/MazE/SpoVT family DNA-binding domain-containing protein [Gemmatales bacterium]